MMLGDTVPIRMCKKSMYTVLLASSIFIPSTFHNKSRGIILNRKEFFFEVIERVLSWN
jgi:hypothetical protein